ncbi:hypothetical protein N7454_004989 [Penicillium verhagenii]|nr:hypothetical protein N7454_004989 [Penicillium verhagenii]
MGSFAPDDEYGDGHHHDGMDGLVYAEPEAMDGEEERRLSTQGMRKHDDTLPRSDSLNSVRQSNTYPPIAASRSGLFPPPGTHSGSGSMSTATSQAGNLTFPPAGHPSGSSLFTSGTLTESSKPLSPNALSHHDSAASSHRGHSPGMGQSLPHPQAPFARGSLSAPNHIGLPLPQPGAQLPPPVVTSPDARFGLQPNKHTPPTHSGNLGLPVPKIGPDGSDGTDGNQIDKLWAYVRSMHDELTGLRSEVASLRAHIASTNSSTAASGDANHTNSISR